jgi:hypothetical protein
LKKELPPKPVKLEMQTSRRVYEVEVIEEEEQVGEK